MFQVYAGLEKYSCDMCGPGPRPTHTIVHEDRSKADICSVCYGKCLAYPKFQEGIKTGEITVREY